MDTTLKKHVTTVDEWLRIHKKLWSTEKNNKVIYTCITGGYDQLLEPSYVNEDFDYICFTDNPDLKSEIWDVRHLPKETEGLTQIKKQRYVKINAHKVVPEYEVSIWVDGNVDVIGNMSELIKSILVPDCSVYVPKHPQRVCLYDEVKPVISMKKDSADNINPQIERYKKEGFPKGYGLLQSNILIRKHNNEDCIRLMEAWNNEVMNGSHRDQLSFNYCSWKNPDIKVKYLDKGICKSRWFNWYTNHKRIRHVSRVQRTAMRPLVAPKNTQMNSKLMAAKERLNKILTARKTVHCYDVRIY
jgi:hypothetical protein